ncbi:MAG: Bifunctional NAD(P)H-hydrate repair enzyme Nnr [Phycisphaerae bacterium]|nr:Bifunctional NAD(P)H-hydrate repair enzyme Nnr [Phycisphaerae bacterium]
MEHVTQLPPLPDRAADSHKGDFGHLLAVGGALGMSGALGLVGRAAGRCGAGLVSLACPQPSQPIVATLVPEALTIPLPARADGRIDPDRAADFLLRSPGKWTVLAAGPGWGQADDPFTDSSVALMERLASQIGGPTVIDADGLNLLAASGRVNADPWPRLVLTPHPGEMARLLGTSTKKVQSDREAAAAEAVARFARGRSEPEDVPVIVLKGHRTIVTDGRRCYVNATGNSGMATGGSGDVLTGMIAALLAQGMERFDAAVLGVHLHGLAGDLAAEDLGPRSLIAPDLIDHLPAAMRRAEQHKT